jgi:hypothetical protein
MTTLALTEAQSALLSALEGPFLQSFGDGLVLPNGTPASLPGFKGFNDLSAELKLSAINGVKSTFAPFIVTIFQTPIFINVSSFLNGFSAYADSSFYGGVVRYTKDVFGLVKVQGQVRTPTSGAVINLDMLQLPVNFRPGTNHIFACVSNNLFCSVQVSASGVITPRTAAANNTWINLDFSFTSGA